MIVAIGSHPDDILLGCGATLSHLSSAGYRIAVVIVTNGERTSLSDGFADRIHSVGERRQNEAREGFDCLGVDDVTFLNLPDLGVSTSELVERLPAFDERVDVVFTHTSNDKHPDHRATGRAVSRRYDDSKILRIESPSTRELSAPMLLVDVADYHEDKIRALRRHETQQHKQYMRPEAVRKKLAHAGRHLDSKLAERFEMAVPNDERFEDIFETETTVVAPRRIEQ